LKYRSVDASAGLPAGVDVANVQRRESMRKTANRQRTPAKRKKQKGLSNDYSCRISHLGGWKGTDEGLNVGGARKLKFL
jgi:hypothetical protein